MSCRSYGVLDLPRGKLNWILVGGEPRRLRVRAWIRRMFMPLSQVHATQRIDNVVDPPLWHRAYIAVNLGTSRYTEVHTATTFTAITVFDHSTVRRATNATNALCLSTLFFYYCLLRYGHYFRHYFRHRFPYCPAAASSFCLVVFFFSHLIRAINQSLKRAIVRSW